MSEPTTPTQQTPTETATQAPNAEPTIADMIASIREVGADGDPVEPDGEAKPEEPKTEENKAEEPKPEEPKPEEKTLDKWAKLARGERRLREARVRYKQELDAFQQEKASFQAELSRLKGLEENLKRDPYKTLEELGASFDGWQQRKLAGEEHPQIDAIRKEIEALKAEKKAQEETAAKQREHAEQERRYESFVSSVQGELGKLPHFSALTQRRKQQEIQHALTVANEYAQKTGTVVDPGELSRYIDEELAKEAKAFLPSQQQEPRPGASVSQEKQGGTTGNRALSNAVSGERAGSKTMTRADWIKAAASEIGDVGD